MVTIVILVVLGAGAAYALVPAVRTWVNAQVAKLKS